ncbi:MAG: hypothetical protein NVS1B4_03180 [Gemmatimonadaceae bacterium]
MESVLRLPQDRFLPPDHQAFVDAEPPSGRIIVVAPTRAACETIELALGLRLETVLEERHGQELRRLARSRKGFGIVAGTGTGKTLAIRPIAEQILGTDLLRVGVINREREATPETPTWNVVIITTGIARRWFQDGDILATDTLIVDEIHQTSAELELCLALGKRVGCTFIWLSATVDPTFYATYLRSDAVIESSAFDPDKAADVKVVNKRALAFLDERFLRQLWKERRGVAVFLPTRAAVEEAASHARQILPRLNAGFYHGGEPIRVIRPFLEGEARKPYLLAMTAAGQSALNVRGLDTVIIEDRRFSTVIDRGRSVLTQLYLGANEILQMAGRVHGRVEGGRVFILSDRDIDFASLTPTPPEFQLAGDSERVAMTCADLGIRADELELPVPLDHTAYRRALGLLERRGLVENGRLTRYGKAVEALPVDRAWGELIVHADDGLVPFVAVMASIESLHRMTREERDLRGLLVPGSDHLTAYNLYAEAYTEAGYIGEVYGLPRHLFDERVDEWAERRGVLVKSLEDAALGMASIFRSLGLELPTQMMPAREEILKSFRALLAEFMPFALVIDEQTADGAEARVSKTSVCGSWGAVAGNLRYFADKFGEPRAAIEGTQLSLDLVHSFATTAAPEVIYDPGDKRAPLALLRRTEYFGFPLDREVEPIDRFPAEHVQDIRRVLAEALARGSARHPAARRNAQTVDELREVYRRSGGRTPRLGQQELAALYAERLTGVTSLEEFQHANLTLTPDAIVPDAERARWLQLPDTVMLHNREIPIDYHVEETAVGGVTGVARLRLTEKLARALDDSDVPALDRPIRFLVPRGRHGSVTATTLAELRDRLRQPWSDEEVASERRRGDEDQARRFAEQGERRVRELASEFRANRRERDGTDHGGRGHRRGGPGGHPPQGGPGHGRGDGTTRNGSPHGRGRRGRKGR